MSPGTAFAFLLLAPATNVPTLGFVRLLHSTSNLAASPHAVAAGMVAMSVLLSLVIDFLAIDLIAASAAESVFVLPGWFEHASLVVGAVLVAGSAARRLKLMGSGPGDHKMKKC